MNRHKDTHTYPILIDSLRERFGSRLKLIVLFGSRSRGEARPESDHDFFLVIEDLPTDPLARHRTVTAALLDHLLDLPPGISLIAKTPEEITGELTPLLIDVFSDGICLFGEAQFSELQHSITSALAFSGLQRTRIADTWMWMGPTHSPGTWEVDWEVTSERL